jgi:TIR domain
LATIETFLSHSNKDKKIARKLADSLAVYGFDVFVAHDDIDIGDKWEEILKEEIKKCELFIVLLSKNFHEARFTDHEIGIATAFNKQILPIRIDDTKPYGFMSKFQAKKISPNIDHDEIRNLAECLIKFTDEKENILDRVIEKLECAGSFNEANYAAEILFEYTNFTYSQINKIAKAFLFNSQINGGWISRPSCLDFLARKWESIDKDYQSELKRYYLG